MLKRLTSCAAGGLLAAAAASGSASAATFYNVATVGITPVNTVGAQQFIGTNPAAVAWDGDDLYVAGYNATGGPGTTGIIKVSNALTSPTFGTPFGVQTGIPNDRGYIGLDVRNNGTRFDLISSLDSGTLATSRFTMFDADGTERWNVTPGSRPPTGPAIDERVSRAALMWQNSRLVRNYNPDTGVATGNLDPVDPALVLGRDIDYNNAVVSGTVVGDVWIRNNNDVYRAQRTGDGTLAGATLLVDNATANQVGQNIAYLHGIAGTDFAIYNDRASAAVGQVFATVVEAVRDDGSAEPLVFRTGDDTGAFAPANGIGLYDFSWDEPSQTLAVSDFASRQVHFFALTPVPEPAGAAVAGLAGAALLAARARRRRPSA